MQETERIDRLAQLQQELAAARERRQYYDRVATEAQDQSYEQNSEGARRAWVSQAGRLRGHAVAYATRVHELVKEIGALEAGPAAVVVTVAQAADMGETHNYRAVPA